MTEKVVSDGLGPLHRDVLVFVGKGLERLLDRIDQDERPEMPTRQILEVFGSARKDGEAVGASKVRSVLIDLESKQLLAFNRSVQRLGFEFHDSVVHLTDSGLDTARDLSEWKAFGDARVRSWLEPIGCHLQVNPGDDIHFDGAKLDTGNADEDKVLNKSNLAVALAVLGRLLRIEQHPMRIVDLRIALVRVQATGLRARRTRSGGGSTSDAVSKSLERLNSTLPFFFRKRKGKFGEWSSKVVVPLRFLYRSGERIRFHDAIRVIENRLDPAEFYKECDRRRLAGPSEDEKREAGLS